MYAFRVEASLYRENCPKSAATVLLKKTYQALFVFWEINLSFFSVCFTLKRTPSCSRLDTGGKVNLGISSLSRIHWYRLGAIPRLDGANNCWRNLPQLLVVGIFWIKSTSSPKSKNVQRLKKIEQLQLNLLRQIKQWNLDLIVTRSRIKSHVQLHYSQLFLPSECFHRCHERQNILCWERGLAEEAEENRWDLVWILPGTSFGLAGVRPHSSKHFWIQKHLYSTQRNIYQTFFYHSKLSAAGGEPTNWVDIEISMSPRMAV